MNRIKKLWTENKSVILYLIFGGLTTAVNVAAYAACSFLGVGNIVSTIIAWVLAVLFAFITNKLFVFDSKKWNKNAVTEAIQFFACRVGTGVIEVLAMYVFVDWLSLNGTIMKLATNVIVIVLNYILSKLIVFKKGAKSE